MDKQQTQPRDSDASVSRRRPYRTPELLALGNVLELTRGAGGGGDGKLPGGSV